MLRACQPGGAGRAPSGVRLCCSSPHAHRALIAIKPSFVRPSRSLFAGQVFRDPHHRQRCREAEGPRECLAALGSFQACQAAVQVRTPAGLPHGDVRNNFASCRHQANQVGLSRARPAPDAGPDRRGPFAVQLTGPGPRRRRLQARPRPYPAECLSASRSAGQRAWRFALPCRSPARAGSPAR